MGAARQTSSLDFAQRLRSLSPFDYAATLALLAGFTSSAPAWTKGLTPAWTSTGRPRPSYRNSLITVAIQGRVFELSRKVTFRTRYRTVMFAVVVFGGETGALMTIGRQETNWAAHLYVYLALFALGLATLYLALAGTERTPRPCTRPRAVRETTIAT